MTYRQQQSVAIRLGLLGVALAVALWLWFQSTGSTNPALPIAFNLAVGTAGLGLFISFGRAVHRDMWLNHMQQNDYMNALMKARGLNGPFGGFWRTWLHVDQTGRNLDA